MSNRSPWNDNYFRTKKSSATNNSTDDVITLLQKHEESLSQSFDRKLDVVVQTFTTKLDAMMEEIRLLPGGADYDAAMQRLHGAAEETDPNVLAGAASASTN